MRREKVAAFFSALACIALACAARLIGGCGGDNADKRTKDEESIRIAKKWLEEFFRMPLRKGDRRYYDNCLYFFAFLALSGNYRIW